MKGKKVLIVAISVLLFSLTSIPAVVYASNTVTITPSSAYVGMFRTILIDVKASDTSGGMWQTGVWADSSTVPPGVWIDFEPSSVNFASAIDSHMLVHAGPAATPGTYSITIVAGWTTIIRDHWETRETFTLTIQGVTALSGYENPWEKDWAQNPDLNMQNPPNPTAADKWFPGVRLWNFITSSNVPTNNSPTLYANWNQSGLVTLYASATSGSTVDQVAHFIQGGSEGVWYQPTLVTLDPSISQINLKALILSSATNYPTGGAFSWTGMKFDVYAKDIYDGRVLYMELYFVRTGGNLNWQLLGGKPGTWVSADGNEVVQCPWPFDSHTDDFMVDINVPTEAYNQAYTSIIPTGDGGALFSIDLTGFFGEAAYQCQQSGYPIWQNRSINDYQIYSVAVCIEANKDPLDISGVNPTCWLTLAAPFEVKGSYVEDINLDGKVDIRDVNLAARAYGTKLGDTAYFPNADVNLDGHIDIKDVNMIAKYYGAKFP